MPATSLEDLQQQIAQREQELDRLRLELQSRQSRLSELARQKEDLESKLRQVDEEIAALGAATSPVAKPPAPSAPRPSSAAPVSPQGQPRLRDLIQTMLQESAAPMTAGHLCAEAQRRGYQPTTQDPVSSVKARLQEMRSEGIIQRASGQPGYILVASANGTAKQSKPSQPASTGSNKTASKSAQTKPAGKKNATAAPSARTSSSAKTRKQPPLREVLTGILRTSRKPLFGSELAAQALATGYRSNSQNFTNTVTALLTKMDAVEHITGQGYRLRKKA
jgi:hypothetical protein